MKLEEARALYRGEWIAFRAFAEQENPEGEVILHNKDRRTFDKELLESFHGPPAHPCIMKIVRRALPSNFRDLRTYFLSRGATDVYITFAGPPVPEGYAVMF